jgi:hypothetical protein
LKIQIVIGGKAYEVEVEVEGGEDHLGVPGHLPGERQPFSPRGCPQLRDHTLLRKWTPMNRRHAAARWLES